MVGAIVFTPTDAASREAELGSAQRVVVARARAPCNAAVQHCLEYLALSIRNLSSRGALGWSYSSRVYFWKLHHALCRRRAASMDRSALWLTFPPRYTKSFVWLYTWSAAPTLYMAVDSGFLFVRKYMISVLGFQYGEAKRRAQDHDQAHHLPELLGRLRDDSGIVSVKHTPQ